MSLHILKIILGFSFVLPLSDSQLEQIKLKTQDINTTPDFNLKSIESNNFNDIKSIILLIMNANEIYKSNNQTYCNDISILIKEKLLSIDENNFNDWIFQLNNDKNEIIASSKHKKIDIVYNVKDNAFSFLVEDENVLLKEDMVSLSNLRGKVILINFWATWCGPCIMEIPDFNELYKKYSEDDFEILGISISDSKKQLIKFKLF